MSIQRLLTLLLLAGLLASAQTARATFTISLDPQDLLVRSDGTEQFFDINVLINYDGTGPNTLSGFTLDLIDPAPGDDPVLEPIERDRNNVAESDFEWDSGPTITELNTTGNFRIDATNTGSGNNIIPLGPSNLVTIPFRLSESVILGSFSLDLELVSANRDLFTDASGDFLPAIDGNLVVTAVPEPTGFGALAIGSLIVSRRRGKRAFAAKR